jgi:hypothetical protein
LTMYFFDLWFLRVLWPFVGTPQGVQG